jgi:prepilin-type N-terminal cleavage/methylation domain-containing protein
MEKKCLYYKGVYGFTLAEILITLLIIGVIAALVIPNIINDVQDAEFKTSFKKAYSTISQAWKLAVAENPSTYTARGGWTCTWPTGETQDYSIADGKVDALKAKLSVTKTCTNQDGCWPSSYEDPGSGTTIVGFDWGTTYSPRRYSWITSDGMCWAAPWHNTDDSHIIVDTNCNKGPNLIGKDIFSFLLGIDGVVYFAVDSKVTNDKPISSGQVCPWGTNPITVNGRSIDFKIWLTN